MWVRFFVKGKSEAETYRYFSDDTWGEEDLRSEAEDWASNTSHGLLNDRYTYGFERVEKLPAKVKAAQIETAKRMRESAERMLAILESEEAAP